MLSTQEDQDYVDIAYYWPNQKRHWLLTVFGLTALVTHNQKPSLTIDSGLKRTLASSLFLTTVFSVQPVAGQNFRTQALPDVALSNSQTLIEQNADFKQNYPEDFLMPTFADTENIEEEIALIYGWVGSLGEMEELSDRHAEFSPIKVNGLDSKRVAESEKTNFSLPLSQQGVTLSENSDRPNTAPNQDKLTEDGKEVHPFKSCSQLLPTVLGRRQGASVRKPTPNSQCSIPVESKVLQPRDELNQSIHQVRNLPQQLLKAENVGRVELRSEQKNHWHQAQQDSSTPASSTPEVDDVLNQLDALSQQRFSVPFIDTGYRLSPGFTISNPNGYGADNNTIFVAADYQSRTRFTKKSDGEMGFGVGLGDAINAVGVELAYTINSFGTSRSEFGSGAFSIKIHRRITEDMAVAVGWNQFARIERNSNAPIDYPKNSYYAVFTKIFKTQEFIDEPFSRVAVTVGIGGGQFLTFDRINQAVINDEDPTGLAIFGSVGFRVFQPVSVIIEGTGQDLGVGLSIVPFKNIPLVITPAIRDISGAGDGARFIMGTGISFQM